MSLLKAYLMGGFTFLIAAFCILYPLSLREPLPAELEIKVIKYTEWREVPGETIFVPGETIFVYDDSLETEIEVSRDSLHIETDELRGYVLTCYDHFRDRFEHEYSFDVLKETEIIQTTLTHYVDKPRRIFPLYINGKYMTGIGSKSLGIGFGGRLFEKVRIGIAGEIVIREDEVIGMAGLEAGWDF